MCRDLTDYWGEAPARITPRRRLASQDSAGGGPGDPLAASDPLGSRTPGGRVPSPSNCGRCDQSSTRLKSTSPPENLARRKLTWLANLAPPKLTTPPENSAAKKSTTPPESRVLPKSTRPPENVAPLKLAWPSENLASMKLTSPPENLAWMKLTWAPENRALP